MSDTLLVDLSPEDRQGLGRVLVKALIQTGNMGPHLTEARKNELGRILADAAVDYLDVADPDDEGGE